jgi:hypothetical protein
MSHLTPRTRWARIGVGGACLAATIGFAAGPALGALAGDGQPPPGSKVPKTTDYVPGQPPQPGTSVPKTTDYVLGEQPANPNPEPPTGQTSQVDPDEPAGNTEIKPDLGVKDVPPSAE